MIRLLLPLMLLLLFASPTGGQPVKSSGPGEVVVLNVPASWPGKILVSYDEWVLSDWAFEQVADTRTFALNVADWFTGGRPGRFLAYSWNWGLTGSSLAATMRAVGHSWTVSTGVPPTLSGLLRYDAVFLAGAPIDNGVLIDYVRAGGNVYLSAGTGWFGGGDRRAEAEAAAWNNFLSAFGLRFLPYFVRFDSNPAYILPVTSNSRVFAHVTRLAQYKGNPIEVLEDASGDTSILVTYGGHGLFAAYSTSAIPVSIDLAPGSCPKRISVGTPSRLQVAIAGTQELDVGAIDVATVRLVGVAPRRVTRGDVTSPAARVLGKFNVLDCTQTGPDRYPDLRLEFDSQEVVAAIEGLLGRRVEDNEALAVPLTGKLSSNAGGRPIVGEDLALIVRPVAAKRLVR